MSDPPLSDIDFKNKMAWVWTTLEPDHILWENSEVNFRGAKRTWSQVKRNVSLKIILCTVKNAFESKDQEDAAHFNRRKSVTLKLLFL